jgi:uncharacterized Tic20 family protein
MTESPFTPGTNDKLLAILCHVSTFLGVGLIFPLILYLVKKNEPGPLGTVAKEVLNFHLSLVIYALCCIPLMFILIGFALVFAVGLFGAIMAVVAAIKCSEGQLYRYPFCLRMIG